MVKKIYWRWYSNMWELALIAIVSYVLFDYLKDVCWWIAGPINWFGIANSIEVAMNYDTLLDYFMLKFSKVETFTVKIMTFSRYLVTNNPDNVKYILRDNFENFIKGREFQRNFELLLGDGIFSMDGPKWKAQRHAAAKIFHVSNFRDNMIHVFNHHFKTVNSILNQGKPVDFHGLMHGFTLDSFSEIGFGQSVDSLRSKESSFAIAFDQLQKLANEAFFLPKFVVTLKDLLLNRYKLKSDHKKTIDQFSYSIIQARLQKGDVDKDDLLCHFLRMKKETGETYKPEDLRNIVMNFILAGRDTTAQAISWTVYELRKRKDIVEKIRAEAKAVIKNLDTPTYEEIKSLHYTTAVFQECLRLNPSVPKNVKFAVHDDVLPDGTKIRKGWGVAWSPYCMARTPSIWGPDCRELKPERFLSENYDPSINFTFHAGPRTCLGQNMATLEAVATIAMLYSKFDIEVLNETTYNVTVTLQMKNPIMVRATSRQ
eukprot:NODE_123_length_17687_cov_0.732261.p5 type:complete len:485 gc:universal NODE_123_length_17687_cov_0.732261:11191-12645(+)